MKTCTSGEDVFKTFVIVKTAVEVSATDVVTCGTPSMYRLMLLRSPVVKPLPDSVAYRALTAELKLGVSDVIVVVGTTQLNLQLLVGSLQEASNDAARNTMTSESATMSVIV